MKSIDAIVTRVTKLGDTSYIVHWHSLECGLLKTVAKGARQAKSPFAGKIDLFFGAEMVFTKSRKGDLHHLREMTVHDWRQDLRRSYAALLMASYFVALIEATLEPEHPDVTIHDLLQRGLNFLNEQAPSRKALLHFEKQLLELAGYHHHSNQHEQALLEMLGKIPPLREEVLRQLNETSH